MQKAYHATYSSYARGVLVLVNRSFPGEIEKAFIDTQRKYVILLYTIRQQRYLTVAVYIPPPFSVFLNEIIEKIIQYLLAKLLLIGDFNAVLSAGLDRPGPLKQHSAELNNWAQAT